MNVCDVVEAVQEIAARSLIASICLRLAKLQRERGSAACRTSQSSVCCFAWLPKLSRRENKGCHAEGKMDQRRIEKKAD